MAGHRTGSIACWQRRFGVSSDRRRSGEQRFDQLYKRIRNCESPLRRSNYLFYFAVELRPLGHCTRMGGEPHYSGNFGLLPPGVMVVYTPRDEVERNVCRLLFSISNNCALGVTSSNNTESYMLRRNAKRCRTLEQAVAGRKNLPM